MTRLMFSNVVWRKICELKLTTSESQVSKLAAVIDERIKKYGTDATDSDQLYILAHAYRIAAIAVSKKYTPKCIRLFKLASKRASNVPKDRIDQDLAAWLDAVRFETKAPLARRMLRECMHADCDIIADATITLSMSYDTKGEYAQSIASLQSGLDKYEEIIKRLKKEMKWMRSRSRPNGPSRQHV